MWLSEMSARAHAVPESAAETGNVTIGGALPGVQTDGERRALPVGGPAGYRWTPKQGTEVLVIKTGDGERVIVGTLSGEEPEEIRICAGGAEICLKNGQVSVTGELTVGGVPVQMQG